MLSCCSLHRTGLWLALSCATLPWTDCKEQMCDSTVVPPIHSLSLVHSLKGCCSFKGFIYNLTRPVRSHVLSKGSLILLVPLSVCPLMEMSQILEHVNMASLFDDPMCHIQLAKVICSSPRNNSLRRSCLITSFSSMTPVSCKICLQHIQQLLAQCYLCSSKAM